MSNKAFGRARKGSGKARTTPSRLTSQEQETLQRIREGSFRDSSGASLVDHKALSGIEKRSRRRLEQYVEKRCLFLLANSDRLSHQRIAVAVALCTLRNPCRNAVCSTCKHRFVEYRKDQAWNRFMCVPREDIYSVTVLCALIYGGIRKVKAAIRKFKALVRDAVRLEAKRDLRFKDLAWLGSFEIDLYAKDIDVTTTKGKTLAAMEGFKSNTEQALQVLHFHLIVASNDLSREELSTFFEDRFPGVGRTLVKGLFTEGEVKGHVQWLAGYMSKCHPLYQDPGEPPQQCDKQGGEADAKRFRRRLSREESLKCLYDVHDLLYHARLHEALGGLGGAFKFDRGCYSRSSTAAPRKRRATPSQRRLSRRC